MFSWNLVFERVISSVRRCRSRTWSSRDSKSPSSIRERYRTATYDDYTSPSRTRHSCSRGPRLLAQHQKLQGTRFHVWPGRATVTCHPAVLNLSGLARASRLEAADITGASASLLPLMR